MVPAIVDKVRSMDHYVRGKTWIANQLSEELVKERAGNGSSSNFQYSEVEKEFWKLKPEAYVRYRKTLEFGLQGNYKVTHRENPQHNVARIQYENIMRKRLAAKPELADLLIPDFPPLCKRLTPGPGYLEALTAPHVNVIPEQITHINTEGIVTADGVSRPVDSIICATGFETAPGTGFPIYGRDGVNLRHKYTARPRSYLSVCTDGFPNFFQSLGPNSFQGSGSLLMPMEQVHRYMGQILRRLACGNVRTVEPKRRAVNLFTDYCDQYFHRTVYTTDCVSWYKATPPGASPEEAKRARVTALWPGSSVHCMKALEFVRWEDYEIDSLDGNEFGWFGNGYTVGDQNPDPANSEPLTWYLNNTGFLHESLDAGPEKEMLKSDGDSGVWE